MGYISRHYLLMAMGLARMHTTSTDTHAHAHMHAHTILRARRRLPAHTLFINLKKRTKFLKPGLEPSLQQMSINNPTTKATGPTAHLLYFSTFIHGSRVKT